MQKQRSNDLPGMQAEALVDGCVGDSPVDEHDISGDGGAVRTQAATFQTVQDFGGRVGGVGLAPDEPDGPNRPDEPVTQVCGGVPLKKRLVRILCPPLIHVLGSAGTTFRASRAMDWHPIPKRRRSPKKW